MEDYDDNNGKSKETGGYLATYARLKSLRHESLSPEQARVAAAAAAAEETGSPRATGGTAAGGPAALARAASLSRRPSIKPAATSQQAQQQPHPTSATDYHPVLQSHSVPQAAAAAAGRATSPSSPFAVAAAAAAAAAGTGGFGRASLDAGGGTHSPRAVAGSHHAEHERWWARMDSASFNAPQAPGPLDPAPAPSPRAGGARRASSPGGGYGFFGEAEEHAGGGGEGGIAAPPRLWSPYSLRRRSTGGSGGPAE
jgi:hypothetical protein